MNKIDVNEASYRISYYANGKLKYKNIRAESEWDAKLIFKEVTGLRAVDARRNYTAAEKRKILAERAATKI
jgi:hypothetical protein